MKAWLRSVSALTAFCFLCTQSVWGIPQVPNAGGGNAVSGGPTVAAASPQMSPSDISALVNWHVPEAFGTVQDRSQGTADKVIFHIQDTHGNYESQMHTAQILEMLLKGRFKDKVRLISVEGAAGRIDLGGFKVYPNKDVLKDISDYFLRQAVITGTEFFSIFSEEPLVVHGAEDLDLYAADLKDFLVSHALESQVDPVLNGLKDAFSKVAQAVYGPKAMEFIRFLESHKRGDTGFSRYCEELAAFAAKAGVSLKPYGGFEKILASIRIENGIATESVEKERGALIAALEKKMVQEDLADLIGKSLLYRTGKISSDEFYNHLDKVASKYGIDWKSFKNLQGYIQMVRLQSAVKTRELFAQCDQIETEIKAKWLGTPLEKDFDAAVKKLGILDNLIHLRMSRSELEFYEKHKDTVKAAALADFLKTVLGKIGVQTADAWQVQIAGNTVVIPKSQIANMALVDERLDNMQAFYQKALLRDQALVRNTLRMMDEKHLDAAVLVTGGFHSEGTMKLFKEKGISYVVVNPRLTKTDQEALYFARMLNEELPLESFFARMGNRIAIPDDWSDVPVDLKFILPNGKPYDLNTGKEKQNLLQTLRALYISAVARKITQDGGEITREALLKAVNGLASESGMPVMVNIKRVGDQLQILFGLSEKSAGGEVLPREFVVKVPLREFAKLEDFKAKVVELAKVGQTPYVVAERSDSAFATAPVAAAAPIKREAVVDISDRLIENALAKLAENPADETARKDLERGVQQKALAKVPRRVGLDFLANMRWQWQLVLASADKAAIEQGITAMWDQLMASQATPVEQAATGTDGAGAVVMQPSRTLTDTEIKGLRAMQEALLLAQQVARATEPRQKKVLDDMIAERTAVAEKLAEQDDLVQTLRELTMLRIDQLLSRETRREEANARFFLTTLQARMPKGAWHEQAYNRLESDMARDFQLRPPALMRLYLDARKAADAAAVASKASHQALTARDQHVRLQSLMVRFPLMTGAELRDTILILFEGNPKLHETLEASLVITKSGDVMLLEPAERIAESADVYAPIESTAGLPEGTAKTQALLTAIMGDKPEIMRHSMSVTKIVLKLAQKLGLDPELIKKAVQSAQLHDLGKAVEAVFRAISVPRNLTPQERDIIGLHDEYSGIIVEAMRQVPFDANAENYAKALAEKMASLDAAKAEKNPRWIKIPESDIHQLAGRIVKMDKEVIDEVQALPPEVLGGITGHHGKPVDGMRDNPDARLVNYLIELADETHAMKDARRYILAQGGKDDTFLKAHLIKKIDGDPVLGTVGMLKMEADNPAMREKLLRVRSLIDKNGLAMFGDVVGPYGDVLQLDVVEQLLAHRGVNPASASLATQYARNPRVAEAVLSSNLRVVENPQQKADGTFEKPLPEQKNALLNALLKDTDSLPPALKDWVMDPGRAPPVILNADAYLDLSPAQVEAMAQGAPVILVGRESEYGFKFAGRTSLVKTYKIPAANVYAYYPDAPRKIQSIQTHQEAVALLDKIRKGEQPLTQPEYETLKGLYHDVVVPGSREDREISGKLAAFEAARWTKARAESDLAALKATAQTLEFLKRTQGLESPLRPEDREFWMRLLAKARGENNALALALTLNDALGYFPNEMAWRSEQKEVLQRLSEKATEERAPPSLSKDDLKQILGITLQGNENGAEYLANYWVEMLKVMPGLGVRDMLRILLESRLQLVGKNFAKGNEILKIGGLDDVNGELFFREIAIRAVLQAVISKYGGVIDSIVLAGSATGTQRAYKLNLDIKLTSDYDVDIVLKKGLPPAARAALMDQIKGDIEDLAQKNFGLMEMFAAHVSGRDVLENLDLAQLAESPEVLRGELDFLGRNMFLNYVMNWTGEVYYTAGERKLPEIAVSDTAEGFEYALKQMESLQKTRAGFRGDVTPAERISGLAKYVLRAADGYLATMGIFMSPAEIAEARKAGKSYEEAVVERAASSGKFDEKQMAFLGLLAKVRLGEAAPEGVSEEQIESFVRSMTNEALPVYLTAIANGLDLRRLSAALKVLQGLGGGQEVLAMQLSLALALANVTGSIEYLRFADAVFKRLLEVNPTLKDVSIIVPSDVPAEVADQFRLGAGKVFAHEIPNKFGAMNPYLQQYGRPGVLKELGIPRIVQIAHAFDAVSQDIFSRPIPNAEPVRLWLAYAYWQILFRDLKSFLANRAKVRAAFADPKHFRIPERALDAMEANISMFESRLHGIKEPVRREQIPLKETITVAIFSVKKVLIARYPDKGSEIFNMTVNMDGIPADLVAGLDKTRLYSTLDNLIQNAMEAMLEDPDRAKTFTLTIAAKKTDDGGIELSIQDNGSGIDPLAVYAGTLGRVDRGEIRDPIALRIIGALRKKVEKATEGGKPVPAAFHPEMRRLLFLPFVTVGKAKGTGIGLNVVKQNMDDQWGMENPQAIAIASKAGEGTTFTLRFPGEEKVVTVPAVIAAREVAQSRLRLLGSAVLSAAVYFLSNQAMLAAAGFLVMTGVAYGAYGGLIPAVKNSKVVNQLLMVAGVGTLFTLGLGFFQGVREWMFSRRTAGRLMIFGLLFFLASPAPAMAMGGTIAFAPSVIQALSLALSIGGIQAFKAREAFFRVAKPEWEDQVAQKFLSYDIPPGSRLANLLLGEDREEAVRSFVAKLVAQSLADTNGLGHLRQFLDLAPDAFFKKVRDSLEESRGQVPAAVLYLYAQTLFERWQKSGQNTLDANFNAAYNIMRTGREEGAVSQPGEFWVAVQRQFYPDRAREITRHFGSLTHAMAQVPGGPVVQADALYPTLVELKRAQGRIATVVQPVLPDTMLGTLERQSRAQVDFQHRYLMQGAISTAFLLTMAGTVYGAGILPAFSSVALTAGMITVPLLLGVVYFGTRFMIRKLYPEVSAVPKEMLPVAAPIALPEIAPTPAPVVPQELPLGKVREELQALLKSNPTLFDGIMKEGDRQLYQKGFEALIEEHPMAVLSRLVFLHGKELSKAVQSRDVMQLAMLLAEEARNQNADKPDMGQNALGTMLLDALGDTDKALAVITNPDSMKGSAVTGPVLKGVAGDALATKAERLGRALDWNHFVFRNKAGKPEARPGAPLALVNLLKSADVAGFTDLFDPDELEAVLAAIEKEYGVRPASKFVVMQKFDGTQKSAASFRENVYSKVQEMAGKKLADRNILIIPTNETYLDIFRQEAGNVLFMLFSGANQVVLSGNFADAIKDQVAQMGGEVTAGGIKLDLIIETRTTMEERAMREIAVAKSA